MAIRALDWLGPEAAPAAIKLLRTKLSEPEWAAVGSARTGRPAHLLEKDIWVLWALSAIYESTLASKLTFKGGTSLSKVYRIIDRFSEDVDLTYDIRELAADLLQHGNPISDAFPAVIETEFTRVQGVMHRFCNTISTMKTATLPPVRVRPEFRAEIQSLLGHGETLSEFLETSVRDSVQRRRNQQEFVRRGMVSLQNAKLTDSYVDADAMLARLERKLVDARALKSADHL
jgi:hypothetical protein